MGVGDNFLFACFSCLFHGKTAFSGFGFFLLTYRFVLISLSRTCHFGTGAFAFCLKMGLAGFWWILALLFLLSRLGWAGGALDWKARFGWTGFGFGFIFGFWERVHW